MTLSIYKLRLMTRTMCSRSMGRDRNFLLSRAVYGLLRYRDPITAGLALLLDQSQPRRAKPVRSSAA